MVLLDQPDVAEQKKKGSVVGVQHLPPMAGRRRTFLSLGQWGSGQMGARQSHLQMGMFPQCFLSGSSLPHLSRMKLEADLSQRGWAKRLKMTSQASQDPPHWVHPLTTVNSVGDAQRGFFKNSWNLPHLPAKESAVGTHHTQRALTTYELGAGPSRAFMCLTSPSWVGQTSSLWVVGWAETNQNQFSHSSLFLSTCPILLSTHHTFISSNFSPRLDPHTPLFLTMILMLRYSDSPLEPSSPPSWIEFKATPVSLSFSHCPHPLHHRLGKTDPITVFLNFTGWPVFVYRSGSVFFFLSLSTHRHPIQSKRRGLELGPFFHKYPEIQSVFYC